MLIHSKQVIKQPEHAEICFTCERLHVRGKCLIFLSCKSDLLWKSPLAAWWDLSLKAHKGYKACQIDVHPCHTWAFIHSAVCFVKYTTLCRIICPLLDLVYFVSLFITLKYFRSALDKDNPSKHKMSFYMMPLLKSYPTLILPPLTVSYLYFINFWVQFHKLLPGIITARPVHLNINIIVGIILNRTCLILRGGLKAVLPNFL